MLKVHIYSKGVTNISFARKLFLKGLFLRACTRYDDSNYDTRKNSVKRNSAYENIPYYMKFSRHACFAILWFAYFATLNSRFCEVFAF